MKKISISLLILVFVNYSSIADGITPEIKKLKRTPPKSVLFIGNSYLYYNDSLHNHFKRMADEKYPGYEGSINVKSSTIGGSRLKHHNLDHLLKPKAISSISKFELVVLQGGSGEGLSKKDRKSFARVNAKKSDTIEVSKRVCENMIETVDVVKSIVNDAQKTFPKKKGRCKGVSALKKK